jgi:hypothetical protein
MLESSLSPREYFGFGGKVNNFFLTNPDMDR